MFYDNQTQTIVISEPNLAKNAQKRKKVINVRFEMDNGLDCTFSILASISVKGNPVLHIRTVKRKTGERKIRSLMGVAVDEHIKDNETRSGEKNVPLAKKGRRTKKVAQLA